MNTLNRETWSNMNNAISVHATVLPRERSQAPSTDFGSARSMRLAKMLSSTPANINRGPKPHGNKPAAASPPPTTPAANPPETHDGFSHCAKPAATTGSTITATADETGGPTEAVCNVPNTCAPTTLIGVAAATATPRRSQPGTKLPRAALTFAGTDKILRNAAEGVLGTYLAKKTSEKRTKIGGEPGLILEYRVPDYEDEDHPGYRGMAIALLVDGTLYVINAILTREDPKSKAKVTKLLESIQVHK
jgi:hypothetical protein